ncbi:MAG: hypothetical protein ACTIK0_05100 [Ruoffia tabacinasalis]
MAGYHLSVELDENKFKDQIISKYTTFFAEEVGVDAMVDPTGHIIGVNGNFERMNIDGFANVDTVEAPFIANILKKANI